MVCKTLNLPYQIVMGYLSEHIETYFFDNTLRLFIENNICPAYERVGKMTEDVIINMVYHYYSTMALLHARITPFHWYRYLWNEEFDVFMTRAERIIASANIPTLTMDQYLFM